MRSYLMRLWYMPGMVERLIVDEATYKGEDSADAAEQWMRGLGISREHCAIVLDSDDIVHRQTKTWCIEVES